MRFLPLAVADMSGEGVCVAGLDIDAEELVRLVLKGRRCLFTQQASRFVGNAVHQVRVGKRQPRECAVDPERRHTEDLVMTDVLRTPIPLRPKEKLDLLSEFVDHDLRLGIAAGGRSLFLVEPREYSYHINGYGKRRFGFRSSVTATFADSSSSSVRGTRISVSHQGAPCTCPAWAAFAAQWWPGQTVTQKEVATTCPGSRLFLLLSLSALYRDRYWLIAAGAHVVGEDRIWL